MNIIGKLLLSKKEKADLQLINEVKAKLPAITTQQQAQIVNQILSSTFGSTFISTGQSQDVNKYILNGFDANSTVYSIISNTSKKFSTIPWILYKVGDQKKALRYKSLSSDVYSSAALMQLLTLKEQAFDEVDSHPMLDMWDRPNYEQSGAEFRESAMAFKMLTGSAPIYCNRGISGVKPQELLVLPTQFVTLAPSQNNIFQIGAAWFTITGAMVPIPITELLYWKYFNPNFSKTGDHLYGQAPLRAACLNLAADNQNSRAQEFMFRNTGVPGLFVPENIDVAAAADSQADQIRETLSDLLNAREAGTQYRPYHNMPMKYIPFGMDAEKLQLMEAARLNAERLANVWNYPPALITQERTTDNNYQNAVKYLVTNTIYADLCSFRDQMNTWYLKQWGISQGEYFFDFDITALAEMQEDMQKMADSLSKMDFLTPNEKRMAAKFDKIDSPAYDTAWISAGLTPIDAAFTGDSMLDPNLMP